MNRPDPLFIIGNKRSGSSLIVNLLNLHPNVLVTHEADIIWLLYQLDQDPKGDLKGYPMDEEKGLRATLEIHGDLFDQMRRRASITDEMLETTFYEFFRRVNETGRGLWDHSAQKSELRWVGDKKPVQHTDPSIWSFVERVFPQARYLHVIRDPRYVVASMQEAAQKWNEKSVPAYWQGTTASIFEDWIRNEESALRIKEDISERVHTVRLEDLAVQPVEEMQSVMRFLGLSFPSQTQLTAAEMVWKAPNSRHEPASLPRLRPSARRILDQYGYGDDRSVA